MCMADVRKSVLSYVAQVFFYDFMNIFRSPLFLWSIPILKFVMFTIVSQGTIKERRYTERI